MMNDESLMPFGKYKGTSLGEVPASYLLWLYEGADHTVTGPLKDYIKENLDVIKSQIEDEKRLRQRM